MAPSIIDNSAYYKQPGVKAAEREKQIRRSNRRVFFGVFAVATVAMLPMAVVSLVVLHFVVKYW